MSRHVGINLITAKSFLCDHQKFMRYQEQHLSSISDCGTLFHWLTPSASSSFIGLLLLTPAVRAIAHTAGSHWTFSKATALVAWRFVALLDGFNRTRTVSRSFMWSGPGMAGVCSGLERELLQMVGAVGLLAAALFKISARSSCLLYHSGSRKGSLLDDHHCKLSSNLTVRGCDEWAVTDLFINYCSGKAFTSQQVCSHSDIINLLFPAELPRPLYTVGNITPMPLPLPLQGHTQSFLASVCSVILVSLLPCLESFLSKWWLLE